jgi:hypothetical protein
MWTSNNVEPSSALTVNKKLLSCRPAGDSGNDLPPCAVRGSQCLALAAANLVHRCFSESVNPNGDGYIGVTLHPDLKPYLLQVHRDYTRFQLGYAVRMESKYAIRLYQPTVFLHQPELARQALGKPRGDCQFDFSDHHSDWFKGGAELDTNSYPPRAKVSKQIEEINIRPDSFHGEWNYTIRPHI